MKKNLSSFTKSKGFTAIELLGVLVILAVLAFGAYQAKEKFFSSGTLDAAKRQIQLVIDNAPKVNPNSARFDGPTALSIQAMNDRNLVPEEWGDGTGANVYGGDISVNPLADNAVRYTFTFDGIPNDEDGLHLVDTFTNVSLVEPTYAARTLTLTLGIR